MDNKFVESVPLNYKKYRPIKNRSEEEQKKMLEARRLRRNDYSRKRYKKSKCYQLRRGRKNRKLQRKILESLILQLINNVHTKCVYCGINDFTMLLLTYNSYSAVKHNKPNAYNIVCENCKKKDSNRYRIRFRHYNKNLFKYYYEKYYERKEVLCVKKTVEMG
jgi:hypothetical protein